MAAVEQHEAALAPAKRSPKNAILLALVAVIVIDILAIIFVPPFPKGGQPGDPFKFPVDGITANVEPVAPHVVWDLDPSTKAEGMIQFHPSITASMLTSWILIVLVLTVMILATRGLKMIPTGAQNVVEFVYESLQNFAISIGGPKAQRYVPLFAAFFLFILFSNWSGLLPVTGRLEFLRAPSSDVNTTIGLALVSFAIFHIEGVRALGLRGYLGKFFPLGEFRNGIGAGAIAMFVGLVELLLEFVKPLTLSMRLFGNIFGGEIALGVMTGLTIALVPVALIGLELLLNFVQALIFSVLTLMFVLAAIEGHHSDEHEPTGGHAPADAHPAPATAAAH